MRPDLDDLARLDRQLDADSERPLRQLAARDREIGRGLDRGSSQTRLLAWLDRVDSGAGRRPRLEAIAASITLWLGVAGLLSGISVMSGLLLVGRQQPVNVLLFLALFIGTQLLLLLLTLAVGIGVTRGSALHLPFENLNPVRLLWQKALARLSGALGQRHFAVIGRLALLRWGQLFGVWFNLGAAAAFMTILLVTDRSFGWSSTLDISDGAVWRLTQLLSAPWSAWLPAAATSPDLVAATRFHALQVVFDAGQSASMRGWWPFLFMSMVCYGLLPRFVLWSVFRWQYRRRLRLAFTRFPGVSLVLGRIDSPSVATQGEAGGNHPQTAGYADIGLLPADRRFSVLLDWAGAFAGSSADTGRFAMEAGNTLKAGLDLEADRQLLQRLNRERPASILIAVKSWEPPLSDLGDFIRGLDTGGDCFLLLLPLRGGGISVAERQDWQHFAARFPHRHLTVLAGEAGPPRSGADA